MAARICSGGGGDGGQLAAVESELAGLTTTEQVAQRS